MIHPAVLTWFSVAETSFYSYTVSKSATEEQSLHIFSKKAPAALGSVFDTLTGLFIKVVPQTLLTIALSRHVYHHLANIQASSTVLSIATVAGRILPFLPLLFAAAPLIGEYFRTNSEPEKELQQGRSFQKLGNYLSRGLEVVCVVLLTSRAIQNDGRLAALVGLATLVAGVVYRYDLLKQANPLATTILNAVFTWKPSPFPYLFNALALCVWPVNPVTFFLLSYQMVRDRVLGGLDN